MQETHTADPSVWEVNPYADVIDSRDVIARIDELEGSDERDADEADELAALLELAEEAEVYAADWRYGETLIRESYFVEYAQELAEDIGAINSDAGWPNGYIDWQRAADALLQDYTDVDFAGVTYFIR
jgi:hypothetical protein